MDPSLDREEPRVGDDLTDAQLAKLGDISLVWTETFAAHPSYDRKAYGRLRRVEKLYGKATIRSVFDYCIERKIVPQGENALPLVVSLAKARPW